MDVVIGTKNDVAFSDVNIYQMLWETYKYLYIFHLTIQHLIYDACE